MRLSSIVLVSLSLGICLFVLGGPPSAKGGEQQVDDQWRVSSRDAANCLYVFAKIYEFPAEYPDVAQMLSGQESTAFSLADIRKAAEKNGIPLITYKTDLEGLNQLPKPLLVHLDQDRSENGEFVLLLAYNGKYWTVFRGTTATIGRIDEEDFRRRWSRYVLVSDQKAGFPLKTSVMVIVVIACYWAIRKRIPLYGKVVHSDEHPLLQRSTAG